MGLDGSVDRLLVVDAVTDEAVDGPIDLSQQVRHLRRILFMAFRHNWLRLLGSTKTPQIDQGVGHQLHAVVAPLDVLETQQQSLEFVLPRKRPFHAIS
jgi:hypothetical protein